MTDPSLQGFMPVVSQRGALNRPPALQLVEILDSLVNASPSALHGLTWRLRGGALARGRLGLPFPRSDQLVNTIQMP